MCTKSYSKRRQNVPLLDKLMNIALPRVRDFRGVNATSF